MTDAASGARESHHHLHSPTISWLLDLPLIKAADTHFIGKAEQLTSQIRWVHVVEHLRSSQLLKGGELVLSTGTGWGESAEDWVDMVTSIHASGATCLLIESNTRWGEIPREIIGKCTELELPLLVTRKEILFVEVTQAVHSEILDRAIANAERMQQVSRTFSSLNQAGADANEIIHQAARLLGCPVVLEDPSHNIVTHSLGNEDPALLANWKYWADTATNFPRRRVGEREWIAVEVKARDIFWGLILYCPRVGALAGDTYVLEQAALSLTIERLSAGPYPSWRDVIEHNTLASLLGGNVSAQQLENSGIADAGSAFIALRLSLDTSGELSLADATSYLTSKNAALTPLVAPIPGTHNEWIVILRAKSQTPPPQLAETLAATVSKASGVHVSVLTSREVVPAGDLSAVVHELRDYSPSAFYHDHEVVAKVRGKYDIAVIAHDKLRDFVQELKLDPRAQEFCRQQLDVLIRHDHAHNSDLVGTLRVLLEHPSSKSAVADTLHISRSALYTRITAIERILGISLANPEALFSLNLATRLL